MVKVEAVLFYRFQLPLPPIPASVSKSLIDTSARFAIAGLIRLEVYFFWWVWAFKGLRWIQFRIFVIVKFPIASLLLLYRFCCFQFACMLQLSGKCHWHWVWAKRFYGRLGKTCSGFESAQKFLINLNFRITKFDFFGFSKRWFRIVGFKIFEFFRSFLLSKLGSNI